MRAAGLSCTLAPLPAWHPPALAQGWQRDASSGAAKPRLQHRVQHSFIHDSRSWHYLT